MRDRLTVAQIDLNHFAYNISQIKKLIGNRVQICGILKANAYGHGSVPLALHAQKMGITRFGVVCLYEARQLRDAGVLGSILILNYTDAESIKEALKLKLTLNIIDETVLNELDRQAHQANQIVPVHVKIDTGMHRLGLPPEIALKFIQKFEDYKNIYLEGVFSHFATSDESDLSYTHEQLARFKKFLYDLKSHKIYPKFTHIANSGAVLRLRQSHLTMIRPGIILYGMAPSNEFALPFTPKPILRLTTQITQIIELKKGETVGYGRTFKANKNMRIAALAVGYADGFRRAPSNWGQVLCHRMYCQVLGRVSMDQSTIDVTDCPQARPGDTVILIGSDGNKKITAEDVAHQLGTINYEVTTNLAARITREYIQS